MLQAVLSRAGRSALEHATLLRPGLEPVDVTLVERPPLVAVDGYGVVRRGA